MKALFAALCLLLAACATPPSPPVWTTTELTDIAKFKYVCRELQVDCSDLRPPLVITSRIVNYIGYRGVTWDTEQYVFVAVGIEKPGKTLVHEMVHYVSLNKGFNKNICYQEQLARQISDKWAGDEPDESWRPGYRCPPKQDELLKPVT